MATKINTHAPMLDELFEEINSSDDILAALQVAFKQPYVRGYFELAVSADWTTLDISTVPFKEYDYHRSMCGSLLLNRQTWNVVENIFMAKMITNRTKAVQFKALSEMLHSGESKLLSLILTKNTESLYPNVTFNLINEALSK